MIWIPKVKVISRMIKICSFKLPEGAGAETRSLGLNSCRLLSGAMLLSSGDGQNYNLLEFFLFFFSELGAVLKKVQIPYSRAHFTY